MTLANNESIVKKKPIGKTTVESKFHIPVKCNSVFNDNILLYVI